MTRPTRRRPPARPTAIRTGPTDVYLCDPDYADLCARELSVKRPPADGVLFRPAGALIDACFAHQVLPRAQLLRGAGPSDLANTILDEIARSAPDARPTAAGVHVSTPELGRVHSEAKGAHPLADSAALLADVLQKKAVGRAVKHGGGAHSDHLLRVLLVDAWGAWVSLARAAREPPLLAWPSPFAGGRLIDEAARDAPSSAWRKIAEALALLGGGPGPGDTVVDLGAAPGGWTRVMLERGARVIAVDRADLDDALERDARVDHRRTDAFTFQPDERVDWWLCDVIDKPDRALEAAGQALERSETRGLVFTLKLTRPLDLAVLASAQKLAARTPGFVGRVKQLFANKLEVTLVMKRG